MQHDFYLAFHYLAHHRFRTLTLIVCLSLMAALPLALHRLLDQSAQQMRARAESTPLLIVPRGSAVDTALAVLQFNGKSLPTLSVADIESIAATGWAETLPLFSKFTVKGHPLVGITLEYLDFRALAPVAGGTLSRLGDCVLGAKAAAALGLHAGDSLLTAPENLFDLAGIFPLKLHVVGVLGAAGTADDEAIFIDLKTSWIIEGLGHGHAAPPSGDLRSNAAAGGGRSEAAPLTYTEITDENIEAFHFHGDPSTYPLTAGIVVPRDTRSATLVKGRFVDERSLVRLEEPRVIVDDLMESFFRITRLFDGVILAVTVATFMALTLVFSLSLRLRRREMETIFLLGCSRFKTFRLVLAELTLLSLSAGLVSFGMILGVNRCASDVVRRLLLPGGG